jgi:hypothetical protein
MQRLRIPTPVVVVLLTAAGPAAFSAEEPAATYLLRYRFRAGDIIHYTVENRSQIELQQGEAVQEVDHQESTNKHYRVISTDDAGNAVLELMIDRVRMTAAVDGGTPVEFDSHTDKVAPAQFVGVAQTVGHPHARIEVSPTGKLLDIEWLVPAAPPASGGLPNEEDAGNLNILVLLPDETVAMGQTWKQRFESEVVVEAPLRKKVTLQRTYRLAAVEGDHATIELQTSIITPLRDPELEAQLIQKTPSGTIEFDLQRGVLLSRSTNLDRTVVGFNGAKSRIRNVTTRTERIGQFR